MAAKTEENIIFNERKYMPMTGNNDVIKKLEDVRLSQYKCVSRNSYDHYNKIKEYKTFISIAAKLVKELGLENNSISISIVLAMLIKNGYFSKKGYFVFDDPSREIVGYSGINVVSGKGCCRNIASFYKDIFDELDFYNHPLPCVNDGDLTLQEAFQRKANHIVNVIEYNQKLYVYDAANRILFDFKNGFTLESIFDKSKKILFYKPSMDMVYNNITKYEVLQNIRKYNEISKYPTISIEEYESLNHETIINISKQNDKLKDFMSDSKKYIKAVIKRR